MEKSTAQRVVSQTFKAAFDRDRFLLVRKHNDRDTPENPFFHLQTQGFWQAWIEEKNARLPLQATPLVNQIGQVFARFTDGFQHLAAIPATRQLMREALIARYFPHLSSSSHPTSSIQHPTSRVADDTPEYGRSPAFRRKILEIYDHQCAACGLRIRLASGNDVSLIDAAHLMPFSESRNDHPTNGTLSRHSQRRRRICKNHHWAMDRDILAPGPDLYWHVSRLVDPRRSNGEKELHELAGKSVLLPKDPAFHPDKVGLEWRREKLIA